MLMSKQDKQVVSVFAICILILITLYTLVAIRFFANDKNEDTLSQSSDVNSKTETLAKVEETNTSEENQPEEKMDLFEERELTNEKKEITNVSSRSKQTVTTTAPTSSAESQATPQPQVETKQPVTQKTQTTKTQAQTQTQTQVSKPAETTLPSIGTIQIPKTNVNMKILDKVSVSGMETNACFLYSTGSLNVDGNTVIVGHNYRNGKLFSNNNKLQIGDVIYITTLDGKTVTYTIYSKFVTTPEDVSFYRRDTNGKPEITLSCCSDDEQTRIILLARPQ